MKSALLRFVRPRRSSPWRTVLFEAVAICVTGLLLGVLGNALSPSGLDLSRNFFPEIREFPSPARESKSGEFMEQASTFPETQLDEGAPKLRELRQARQHSRLVAREQVAELLKGTEILDGRVVLVDARPESHYRIGHLPGAYAFDRFYPERFLPDVLPAALAAERVIVYCTGGECEDSKYAIALLREAGVALEDLYLYAEGMEGWRSHGGVVELGDRVSGKLEQVKP